ncbi:hypothetical protein VTN00DRAFT_9196 [Thermoascus crustaceus]|uniref:uncharacterized protein n=1 Tax=Thermoascus crustaceus TaxID=5088 RepID=UPI003743F111
MSNTQPQSQPVPETMKALHLTRPSTTSPPTLSFTTLPTPTPKPGFLLIRIHYSSIQPSDRLNARGSFPKTAFPRIPGRDYAGVVVGTSSSSSSDKIKIGTEVYGSSGSTLGFTLDGPHAEYCLIPETAVVEKPAPLTLRQAATVGVPFLTALLCLRRARACVDDVVLVLGANGAVGSATVQVARAMGCRSVITASRSRGEDADINLAGESPAGSLRAADIPALLTDGNKKGIDVVVDTVGDIALMGAAMDQLAIRGRYAWIAAPRGPGAKTDFTFDIFQAYRREIVLVGCNTGNYTVEEIAEDLRVLKGWFESGELRARAEEEIEEVGLDEAVEEGYWREGNNKKGPVVIKMI